MRKSTRNNYLLLSAALAFALLWMAFAAHESMADEEDTQAINSREWAAKQACEGSTPVWTSDQGLECRKERP